MTSNVLETKELIEEYKEKICSELKKRIKGYNLYHVVSKKPIFKGTIVDCRVKCFKEYLGSNSVAVDIITKRDGKTLVTPTFIHCIYSENVGFDYFIKKPQNDIYSEEDPRDDNTCPYCGKDADFVDNDEDSTKYQCNHCGKDFLIHDDGTYTTRNGFPIKEE